MFSRRNHPALLITLALVITAILIFTFSPAVRAALETILTFNGVTVSVDQDTDTLVVNGNMDAVVEQTDHSVTIRGENGEEAGAGIAAAQAVESVNVSDLLTSHPNLILPTVPSSYALQPQGELVGESLTFTWQDSSGNLIIYQRSPASTQGELPVVSDVQPTTMINSGSGFISVDGRSVPMVTYNWEAGGYFHELTITDTALSDADLQAMLP
jgi:hypothetical protein